MDIEVHIARCSSRSNEHWEVRVAGPGGWRTSISQASLSACRRDARAWAQPLGTTVTEEAPDEEPRP